MRQGGAKGGRDWRREGLEEDLLPSSYSFPLPNYPTSKSSHFHPFPLPSHTFLSPFLVHLPPTPHDLPPHPSLPHISLPHILHISPHSPTHATCDMWPSLPPFPSGVGRVQPLLPQLLYEAVDHAEQPLPPVPTGVDRAALWQLALPAGRGRLLTTCTLHCFTL